MTMLYVMTFPLAYIGPGLGLGTIAVIFGVLLSVLLAILSYVWYPVKRMIRALRGGRDTHSELAKSETGH